MTSRSALVSLCLHAILLLMPVRAERRFESPAEIELHLLEESPCETLPEITELAPSELPERIVAAHEPIPFVPPCEAMPELQPLTELQPEKELPPAEQPALIEREPAPPHVVVAVATPAPSVAPLATVVASAAPPAPAIAVSAPIADLSAAAPDRPLEPIRTPAPSQPRLSPPADRIDAYRDLVRRRLSAGRVYPPVARRMEQEGHVTVRFRVDGQGAADEVAIIRGSGYPLLDRAAVNLVQRVAPFPPPPEGESRIFQFVIEYSLLEAR